MGATPTPQLCKMSSVNMTSPMLYSSLKQNFLRTLSLCFPMGWFQLGEMVCCSCRHQWIPCRYRTSTASVNKEFCDSTLYSVYYSEVATLPTLPCILGAAIYSNSLSTLCFLAPLVKDGALLLLIISSCFISHSSSVSCYPDYFCGQS